MTTYVYTAKATKDGVGETGAVADLAGKYPLDYLLLHAYVQPEEQVMTGALGAPQSKGSIDSPTKVKPRSTTK